LTKTVTVIRRSVFGNMRVIIASVDVTSYTASGEPLTAAELGLKSIEDLIPVTSENKYVFYYDYASAKLRGWVTSTDTEIAGAVDAGTVRLIAIGK